MRELLGQGQKTGAGRLEGIARILEPQDIGKSSFEEYQNSIIIAPHTTPDYTPYLLQCAGILTQTGSRACHAAIIARELKIPCVVGVDGIIERIKDGYDIESDEEGRIYRIK